MASAARAGHVRVDQHTRRAIHIGVKYVAFSLALACSSNSPRDEAPRETVAVAATPQVIDSAIPRDEAIRRFQTSVGAAATEFTGGAPSLEALARRVMRALEVRDTAALRRLVVSRAEFAYVVYPSSPLGLPPYDLSPGLMWFQLEGNSMRGLTHAVTDRGGRALGFVGVQCDAAQPQGGNRVYNGCMVKRVPASGDTVREQLFGGVVEHGGVFKVLSFANKL